MGIVTYATPPYTDPILNDQSEVVFSILLLHLSSNILLFTQSTISGTVFGDLVHLSIGLRLNSFVLGYSKIVPKIVNNHQSCTCCEVQYH